MGWLKDLSNPFGSKTLLGKQRKEQRSARKNAKKALTQQEEADRVARYEAEVNAGMQANARRVEARGTRTLGSAALASAAPGGLGSGQSTSTAAQVSLTEILARLRGVSF